MTDYTFLILVAVGGSAFFGLHGALGLAIKHYFLKKNYLYLACGKTALSNTAYNSILLTSCMGIIFYCMVLFIIIRGIYNNEISILLLNTAMIIGIIATSYYAFKMFFRIRVVCVGCIRVHLANLMMSSALIFYNFY